MPTNIIIITTISVILLFLVIFTYYFLKALLSKPAPDPQFIKNLTQIDELLNKGSATSYEKALILADKTLDYWLKRRGAKGETMGERLKNAGRLFSKDTYNQVWELHKLRNQLVHDVDFKIAENKLRQSIVKYKNILNFLK